MPLKDKLVRVRARSRTEVVGDEIAGHGFPQPIADQLADRLVQTECLPPDGQLLESLRGLLWNIYGAWSEESDPDILTMLVFRGLVQREYGSQVCRLFQEEPTQLDNGKSRQFAEWCAKHDGCDFTIALDKTVRFLDAHGEHFRPGLDLAQVLWRHKLIEPQRLVDASSLIEFAKRTSIYGGSWSSAEEAQIRKDVRAPAFWIAVDPAAAIQGLTPALQAASDEDLAWLARGIYICANRSLAVSGFTSTVPPVHEVTKFAFDAVDARIGADPRSALPLLRHTWLHHWRELWWRSKIERNEALESRLLAAADLELGSLRSIVERGDLGTFTDRLPALDIAVTCVFELAPLSKGFALLLQAFRKLPVPGVAADLRWWTDAYHRQTPLPEPWHHLASHLVSSFHTYAKREQETDEELSSFRAWFARYCLDRLKSRKSGDGPREDNPIWRLGYIEAALALKTNPDRKGHHTLYHAAKNDPHPEVREAARHGYNILRHGPSLKKGESPRRCVLLAFWHLRQAHLAALGVPIEERGANRIREEEVRRTTEQEQRDQKFSEIESSPPSGPETGPSLW